MDIHYPNRKVSPQEYHDVSEYSLPAPSLLFVSEETLMPGRSFVPITPDIMEFVT